MALFSECTPQCARKALDAADIVRDAILRHLTAHLLPPRFTPRPPLLRFLKVRHSEFCSFVGGRSVFKSEPVSILSEPWSSEPWPVRRVHIPCSHATRNDMFTPRHCYAFRGALGNLDHKSPTPAVELNRYKVDLIRHQSSKWGSDPLNPRSLRAGTKMLFRDEIMSSRFIGEAAMLARNERLRVRWR